MALVKKLNVELTVDDEFVDSYINKGYSVINEAGHVIREAVPNDLAQLKILVTKQKEEIAKLEAEIAKLNGVIKVLKETPKEVVEKQEVVETMEAPKKKASKKTLVNEVK